MAISARSTRQGDLSQASVETVGALPSFPRGSARPAMDLRVWQPQLVAVDHERRHQELHLVRKARTSSVPSESRADSPLPDESLDAASSFDRGDSFLRIDP